MLYSCQSGNGVVDDPNFEYFISHLPVHPIIGVMVGKVLFFHIQPITGDSIEGFDSHAVDIVSRTPYIMLILGFNSLMKEKGYELRNLFGDRLKGEYEKLLKQIKKKKIKVREYSLRVSLPLVETPRERHVSLSSNQEQVSTHPEDETPTRSDRVSIIGDGNADNPSDDELYREGSDLDHSSDSHDSLCDADDSEYRNYGASVTISDDDDDDYPLRGDDDILFNLMSIVSHQGGTRSLREEEELLTSSDVKKMIKKLSDSVVKLTNSYDKLKRSYDKISSDMKREMEKAKDLFVLKDEFEEKVRELNELPRVVSSIGTEIPPTPSTHEEDTVTLRRSRRRRNGREVCL